MIKWQLQGRDNLKKGSYRWWFSCNTTAPCSLKWILVRMQGKARLQATLVGIMGWDGNILRDSSRDLSRTHNLNIITRPKCILVNYICPRRLEQWRCIIGELFNIFLAYQRFFSSFINISVKKDLPWTLQ